MPESRVPRGCAHRAALEGTRLLNPPSHEEAAADGTLLLMTQTHEFWGGPRAGASLPSCVGSPRCSRMARTPPGTVRYASTRRLPPHLPQANTSSVVFPQTTKPAGEGNRVLDGAFSALQK